MRHLPELFLFFTLLMGLPDWYIFRRYIRHLKNQWIRILYWFPSLLLLLSMIILFAAYEPSPETMNYLGIFLVIFLCINVPKVFFILSGFLFKVRISATISLLIMGYLLFGATKGKQHFHVKEVNIQSEEIPNAFDGFRIVHISDIHCGSWAGNTKPLQKAVKLINAQNPDLIVFTGDLVNNLANELDDYMSVLSQLKAKQGVYSVMGNHDYSMYIPWETEEAKAKEIQTLRNKQAQMGWILLDNQHVKLYQENDSIALIGVENSGRPPFPDYARLTDAMQGTEGMFQILLSHDPSHWKREILPYTDINLTLSGHTHAMQTKILGFTPAQFIYEENDGLYQKDNQMLYVNIGLGYLLYPMRLGAWPEITVLTLKK